MYPAHGYCPSSWILPQLMDIAPAHGYTAPAHGYTAPAHGYTAPAHGYTVPAHGYTAPAHGYTAPAHGYTAPAHGYTAPAHGYTAPAHGYTAPAHGYTAPAHGYTAPAHGYTAPAHGYIAPAHGYTAPAHGYTAPAHGYIAPAHGFTAPAHGYTAPAHGYTAPAHGYTAPAHGYTAPAHGYIAPAHGYIAPAHGYIAPAHGYTAPAHGYTAPAHGYCPSLGEPRDEPREWWYQCITSIPKTSCTSHARFLRAHTRDMKQSKLSFFIKAKAPSMTVETPSNPIEENEARANPAASCSLPHNSTTITTKTKNYGDAGKTSKKRCFNTHWLEQFSWLIFSEDTDTVTCKVCSRFPQTSDAKWKDGVKAPFKKETFVWHEKSNKHKENVDEVKAKDTPEERPLAVCIKKMDAEMFQHMKHMFNVAYFVAKSEKPFRDFMDLLTLAAKLDVPILQKYGNDVQCKQFIHFIAKIIRESLVANIKKSTFVGIMIDGSTDRTSTEHANIFLGTFALESATAQGYLKGLTAFLDSLHLDYRGTPWVAGLGTDGAASMLGHKSGLAVQMKDICPQIISIHCVAHRLQLAVLDVCKEVPYLQTFDDVVRHVFKYCHGSAKRLQQLKEVAKSLSEEILKLRDIHTVRCLCSKVDALRAFLQNWKTVVTHFEQISTEGTTDSAKVKGILKDLKQLKFVKLLYFLLDFYSKLKPLSEGLQNKELMICHLKNKLEHAVKTLQDLCKGRGKNELEFVSKFTGNGTIYGLQLTNLQAGEREFNSIRQSVLAKAEKYLILRLSSVSSDIVKSFNIFDSLSWPDKAQILNFGLNELHTIAKHVFNDQFEDKVDILDVEWADLKLSKQISEIGIQNNALSLLKVEQLHLIFCCIPFDVKHLFSYVYIALSSQETARIQKQRIDPPGNAKIRKYEEEGQES
uniref:TTF-type domain-containing protein n=1 Tax=Leptobrachium leishanense TaxID=445787 RepID=A0A8C5LZR6_9ANUR